MRSSLTYATLSALPPVGPGRDLATRLAWVTGLRLVILSAMLALVGAFYLRDKLFLGELSARVLLVAIGASFAVAAAYAYLLHRRVLLTQLAYAQLVVDQLTWTVFAYVLGGVTSGATSFYGLTCLTGAALVGVRGVVVAALSGMGLYLAMAVAFAQGIIRPPADQIDVNYLVRWKDTSYPVTQNLLAVTIVAVLSGYLAERLRAAGGALQAARERAEQAERLAMLGKFAAGLAHEIRNPLGAISGSADLLAMAPGLEQEDRVLCGIIAREAARVNDLVTDMVDLARPRRPEPTTVDAAAIAHEVSKLAAHSGRGVDVRVRCDGPASGVEVEADASQLRQLIWNLLRNAVQASSPGAEVVVRVRGRDEATGQPMTIAVLDSGPGIGEEARDQLFDAFFTTRTQGMGIGLAVVKRIVDEHGWDIAVDNRPEGGAVFRVTVPDVGQKAR